MTKSSWYDNAIQSFQDLGVPFAHVIQGFGVNPLDVDIYVMIPTGMTQGFHNGEVGIVQFNIFADQANGHFRTRPFNPGYQFAPLLHVWFAPGQPKLLHYVFSQSGLFQDERHFIDRLGS